MTRLTTNTITNEHAYIRRSNVNSISSVRSADPDGRIIQELLQIKRIYDTQLQRAIREINTVSNGDVSVMTQNFDTMALQIQLEPAGSVQGSPSRQQTTRQPLILVEIVDSVQESILVINE